jgi:hypothetical protein
MVLIPDGSSEAINPMHRFAISLTEMLMVDISMAVIKLFLLAQTVEELLLNTSKHAVQ